MKATKILASMMLCAAPVAANAVTTITYAGIVADRQGSGNQNQYFGNVVAGATTYTLVYAIDDAAGGTITHPDPYSIRLDGAGSVTVVMTINGISQTIGGGHESHALASDGKPNLFNNPTDTVGQKSQDFTDNALIYRDVYAETLLSSYLNSFLSGVDYTQPFAYSLVPADSFLSTFHINDLDKATRVGSSIYLNLGLTSVVVSNTASVPEPASWALMIGGFMFAGGFARHARRSMARSKATSNARMRGRSAAAGQR